MDLDRIRRFMLPPGPIMSLMLVGIMVLSGLVYYRAVKIQRFLEPALALSQPRNELAERFNAILRNEFGEKTPQGFTFGMGAVVADPSLFFGEDGGLRGSGLEILRKLNTAFYTGLSDTRISPYVGIVLVGAGYQRGDDEAANRRIRLEAQNRAELVMDRLLASDPRLARVFGTFFVAAAVPASRPSAAAHRIEFRIIPSEMLHAEALMRLTKYAQ